MKNIHVLPIDKPSRYVTNYMEQNMQWQNIYITSDEEIKEGDWCYYLNNLGGGNILCQAYKHSEDKRMLFDNGTYNREIGEGITPLIGECKTIILTTDQDLIADGVQAIEDSFLEWFVNNPSCEEVEVKKGKMKLNDDGKEYGFPDMSLYKITIPKEETLEEAAAKHFNKEIFVEGATIQYALQKAFIIGAKWQAERSYTEEDLRNAFKAGREDDMVFNNESPKYWDFETWFEQFKKTQ